MRLLKIIPNFRPDPFCPKRHISSNPSYKVNKLRSFFFVSTSSIVTCVVGEIVFGGEQFYHHILMPVVHRVWDGEEAHKFAVWCAKWRLVPWNIRHRVYPSLQTEVFGLTFPNPVGLAAGFDKDGEAVGGLLKMGFGFVEVGSVTPEPQPGNDKPRVFRLVEDEAVINRYGFNSAGHDAVFGRLEKFWAKRSASSSSSTPPTSSTYTRNSLPDVLSHSKTLVTEERNSPNLSFHNSSEQSEDPASSFKEPQPLVGVNLGKNKLASSPVKDYVVGADRFRGVSDYLVVNVSSPNTPGLRDMQGKKSLTTLLDAVVGELRKSPSSPPLLLKIAPDLDDEALRDVVDVILERLGPRGVSGLIVSNTTISRPSSLVSSEAEEKGGLSGRPLKEASTTMIKKVYRASGGKIPIVGCGGVATGADAYEKIRAGASLIQLYTALVYRGPPVVEAIKRELDEKLKADGFRSVEEAVGVDCLDEDPIAVHPVMEETLRARIEENIAKMASKYNHDVPKSVGAENENELRKFYNIHT